MQPRTTTRQFPLAVQKICQFIQAADSEHPFASFVILRNVHSAMHQDHNNSAAPNLLIPITSFEGGGVWIQDAAGQDFRWHQGSLVAGHLHSFADGPIYLPARDRLRETLPWSGDRAIVAAYTPAGLDALSAADVQFLESLGFCWQPAPPPLGGGPDSPACLNPNPAWGLVPPLRVALGLRKIGRQAIPPNPVWGLVPHLRVALGLRKIGRQAIPPNPVWGLVPHLRVALGLRIRQSSCREL